MSGTAGPRADTGIDPEARRRVEQPQERQQERQQDHGQAESRVGAVGYAAEPWTPERVEQWRSWFTHQLIAANYAARKPNGKLALFMAELNRLTGIPTQTLRAYVERGTQPSIGNATAIARALGLHPMSLAYHAGLLSLRELVDLLGGDAIPDVEQLRASLRSLQMLPDDMWTRQLRGQIERQLQMVERLAQNLGMSPEEFGVIAAEVVRREIAGDTAEIEHVDQLSGALPQEFAAARAQARLQTNPQANLQTPTAATGRAMERRQPGPHRQRDRRSGDDMGGVSDDDVEAPQPFSRFLSEE